MDDKTTFLFLHKILPKHLLSRLLGRVADCSWPWFSYCFIKLFIRCYSVDMQDAKLQDVRAFENFNAFFIRELRSGARIIAQGPSTIVSPVDGMVSQCGRLSHENILQAKGRVYCLPTLLAGQDHYAASLRDGNFLTAYLAPKDYHRYHMPVAGKLLEMRYIPGRLFSVSPFLVNNLDNLFAANERVVCFFETDIGICAYVAVGATIVGSIAMTWHGVVNSSRQRAVKVWDYRDQQIYLQKGEEVGFFKWGSTVILLFQQKRLQWDRAIQSGRALRMGESIGSVVNQKT